jgi:DNA polymerase III subunit delta
MAMTPVQFLARVKRREIPPVCLFLGQESWNRKRCLEALIAQLGAPERQDASQTTVAAIVDDARSMSLFASERFILVSSAEAALPGTPRASAAADFADDEEEESATGGTTAGAVAPLDAYVKDSTPGVVLVFEASRWDFEGDDKARVDRVRKFYSAIPDVVEFRRFTMDEARMELDRLAKAASVRLDAAASEALVEALAGDVGRIAVEIEKLSLYGKPVTADDLPNLVPDARQSTIFALVNALGRRDRARALDILGALIREGEYLPLALTFLATQFRMALAAKEANLRSAGQVQGHLQKSGIPMWGSRAEQVAQTASRFSQEQLERGLKLIFEADRDLRSARPDDRTVIENFVVKLCA